MTIATGLIAGTAAGLVGGLGRKKTPNPPDVAPLIAAANEGYNREKGITEALPDKLAPLGDKYQTSLRDAVTKARADLATAGDNYVSGVGDTSNAMYTDQSKLLKQDALDASAAAGRQMRNTLAAGGTLNSGGGVGAARTLATNTANEIARGSTELGIQALGAKQKALADVYGQDANMVHNALGIDQTMFQKLLDSGREDLINEALQLIQESQNQTGAITGAIQTGQTRQMASDYANAASRNDLTSSIIQALGYGLASRQ